MDRLKEKVEGAKALQQEVQFLNVALQVLWFFNFSGDAIDGFKTAH